MPAQMRHIRAVMRQGMIHDTSGAVNRSLADRLSQAAQSPPVAPQVQPTAPTSKTVSCIASPSDERTLAELEQFDRQCLHAYIASSISADHAPEFEDEAEFSLFQQEAAARRKLDAARREAEALLDADTEQEKLLQAAAQNAKAEQEACCQQLHAAAELMSKPHKFAEMTLEELNLLQGAAQRFLSICNDVRDHLHEQEALKHQQEKLQMVKALRAAEALAEKRSALYV